MHNKLSDLNNYLFGQLERLDNPEMTDEEFEREIKRSKAITETGKTIVDNARLALEGQKFLADFGFKRRGTVELPEMLETHETQDSDADECE